MLKITKYLTYGAMAVLIVMMMTATVVERLHGSPAALNAVYHNPFFIILWAVAAVSGLIYLSLRGLPKRGAFTMGIHVALAVILCGALVTHIWGVSGMLHLREGEETSVFELEDESRADLPFSIRLDSFWIDYHPGSKMPSGYNSKVCFLPEGRNVHISMNNIAKYRGYRFYQADYDEDGRGSILAVSHDPWGIGITYTGYILLLLSMIAFFFQKNTAFRAALGRVLSAAAVVAAFLLLPSVSASAQPASMPGGAAGGSGSLAESIYFSIGLPKIPAMICLAFGVALFVLCAVRISRGRRYPSKVLAAGAVAALVLWLYLTLVIGLRWYLSGTGPYVGRYSVMMLMAWFSSLAVLLLYRRFPLIEPLGFLLAGFTMLIAGKAGTDLRIMPLMPVLQSPLLSIHVISMMMSYTLFGLVAFNGVMGVCVSSQKAAGDLRDVSLVVLYPAVFLLTFGTFLGAVWANISWGSYWAWDPKETWALVTMLVYSLALHGDSLKPFRNPRFFHWFTIAAFLCVLVTYFGVNLLLGGMHSYS